MEEPQCKGCSVIIEEGNVVAFGDGIWHLNCFRCQKCNATVECDSNLLLLSNGNPVCENCSYRCAFCENEIAGEAVMTGDESYHSDCFRCYRCGNRIENLVFAKNGQGICCMACHNERKETQRRSKEPQTATGKCVEKKLPHLPPGAQNGTAAAGGGPYQRVHSATAKGMGTVSPSADSTINNAGTVRCSAESKPEARSAPATAAAAGDIPPDVTSERMSLDAPADSSVDEGRLYVWHPSLSDVSSMPSINSRNSTSSAEVYAVLDGAKMYPVGYVERLIEELRETKEKLASTKSKVHEAESNFQKIKAISRKVLEEFNRAKEDFSREVVARKQAEAIAKELRAEVQRLSAMASKKDDCPDRLLVGADLGTANGVRTGMQVAVQELRKEEDMMARQPSPSMRTRKDGEILNAGQALEQADDATARSSKSYQADHMRMHEEKDTLAAEAARLRATNAEVTLENDRLMRIADDLRKRLDAVLAATAAAGARNPSCSPPSGSPRGRAARLIDTSTPDNISDSDLPAPSMDDPEPSLSSTGSVVQVSDRKVFNGTFAQREPSPKKFKWKGISMISAVVRERDKETGSGALSRVKSLSISEPILPRLSKARRRSHQFQPHTFLRPLKCDLCNEKMWGLQLQSREMRCQACGCHAHAKCAPLVPPRCRGVEQYARFLPDTLPVIENLSKSYVDPCFRRPPNGIIGTELTRQSEKEGLAVPLVVTSCVAAVEARGMEVEGIYRKSGPASMARAIVSEFNAYDNGDGLAPDLLDADRWPDITAVTSVLKQYFRELPEPLITFAAYGPVLEAVRQMKGHELVERLSAILSELPLAHFETLRFLLLHLDSVSARHACNLMPAKNVAVVFGPTLLRSSDASNDASDTSAKNTAVEIMLLHRAMIFNDDDAGTSTAPLTASFMVPREPSSPKNLPTFEATSSWSHDGQSSPVLRSQLARPPSRDGGTNSGLDGDSLQSRVTHTGEIVENSQAPP